MAYLAADYAYGHEMVRGFKRAQTGIGAEAVGEIFHPLGAADYSTFLPRISAGMRTSFASAISAVTRQLNQTSCRIRSEAADEDRRTRLIA